MVKVAAILALSLSACMVEWSENPTHTYSVFVEPGFSDTQETAIFDAASKWEQAMGGFVKLHGGLPTDPYVMTFHPVTRAQFNAEFGAGHTGMTVALGASSDITLSDDNMSDARFALMTLHEIGHALGANHIGPGNVMCQDAGCAGTTITCTDITEVCSHWGSECNAAAMPACNNNVQ